MVASDSGVAVAVGGDDGMTEGEGDSEDAALVISEVSQILESIVEDRTGLR